MKILHITPHLGGGVGTVILNWMKAIDSNQCHSILCLDYANKKAKEICYENHIPLCDCMIERWKSSNISRYIPKFDIIIVHYWDHPMISMMLELLPKPDAKIIFWCHKNFPVPPEHLSYPDIFVDTSPIQGHGRHIWSTGGVDDYLKIERNDSPLTRLKWNVGYIGTVDYKKMHEAFLLMVHKIGVAIPESQFFIVGEDHISDTIQEPWVLDTNKVNFVGHLEDIKPILSKLDVFIYPLRPDHYGTCEQVLGEAMAAGVVPVVMRNPAEKTIITNGVDGFLADSVDGFAHYVEALFDNPRLHFEIAANARKTAAEKYSMQTMINSWNELFTEVLDAH